MLQDRKAISFLHPLLLEKNMPIPLQFICVIILFDKNKDMESDVNEHDADDDHFNPIHFFSFILLFQSRILCFQSRHERL